MGSQDLGTPYGSSAWLQVDKDLDKPLVLSWAHELGSESWVARIQAGSCLEVVLQMAALSTMPQCWPH